jgi:hypothetical protein
LQRIHLHQNDLDWLPSSLKAVRWTVAGTIWTGVLGATIASSVLLHATPGGVIAGAGKGIIVGGLMAGDRVARAILRRRLGKLAHGQVALSRLKQEPDGELVHVRGRVRARQTLTGLLDDQTQAVYRRVQIFLGQYHRVVCEDAVDFALVDDQGESIIVQVADARLVAPEPKAEKMRAEGAKADRLLSLPLPAETAKWLASRAKRQRKGKSAPRMAASEFLLRDGDEIEVVGYKNRVVDVSVEARLERDTPLRATLRAGRALPVILSPALPA